MVGFGYRFPNQVNLKLMFSGNVIFLEMSLAD